MSDPLVNAPYQALMHFKINLLEKGRYFTPHIIPTELAQGIGLVIAYWGRLEDLFNEAIAQAIIGGAPNEPGWETRSFKKRATLLKDILKANRFGEDEDLYYQVQPDLLKAIGDASSVYWKRNVVAHGRYIFTLPPNSDHFSCIAHGNHRGKKVELELSPDNLNKLYHDIAHITGDWITAFSKVATPESAFWTTYSCKEFLRAAEANTPPTSPTP